VFRRLTSRTFSSLRVRNFRLYFIGQSISISGTWMQSLAQAWLVLNLYAFTHPPWHPTTLIGSHTTSPIDLGITVALPFVPMLLFGPFGGLVADRSNKRVMLFVTQSTAGLLALALGILVSTHHVSLPAIWTIAGLLGVVNLFDNPTRQSFVQEMVGKEQLPNAVSLNSAMINGGRIVGPAIGATLFVFVPIATCFYVNAASYVAVIVALAMMRTSEITRIRTVTRASGQVRDGLRYAWRVRQLREVLVAVVLVGTFAFNFTVTLPLLAKNVLHGSASDYALLMCSMGLGGLVGGLVVAHRSRPTRALLCGLAAAFAVLMALVAVAPSIWLACVALVAMGAASLAFIATANSTLQLHSVEEMRGRVMSLYSMGFLGTTPIGALCISAIAWASNARVAIGVGALATLGACAYLAFAARVPLTNPVGPAAVSTESLAGAG
jgi:MFS family permease